MSTRSRKPKTNAAIKKYIAASAIGLILGFLNFLSIYYLQSSCIIGSNYAPLVQVLMPAVDVTVFALAQLFLMRGARKIAVPFMVLFFLLGVSPAGTIAPTCPLNYCVPKPGFTCYYAAISGSGNLTLQFVETNGSTLYNVGMACATYESAFLVPDPSKAMIYLSGSGAATPAPANAPAEGALSMPVGERVNVTGLKCWGTKAEPLNASNFGQGGLLEATLWLNYTTNPGVPGAENPMHTLHLIDVGAVGR